MKKFALLTIILSGLANAHSHQPHNIDKYVLDSVYELKFELMNHFKNKTCYDIEVNGKIYSPLRTCLNYGEKKEIGVWLQSKPDEETQNIVCSISDIKGNMRTRMCTTANTIYPREHLQ